MPPGVERLAADAENHDFAFDLAHHRLLYVSGSFPRKSYLCLKDLRGGGLTRIRVLGQTLDGALFPARDGRSVLASSKPLESNTLSPRSAPRVHAVLKLDLETGTVSRVYQLPQGRSIHALAQPRWATEPLLAFTGSDGSLRVAPAGLEADLEAASAVLEIADAAAVAFADDEPALAATFGPEAGSGAAAFLELGRGRRAKVVPLRSPGLPLSLGGGRWLAAAQSQSGHHELLEIDPAAGRVRALLETRGRIETIVAGRRWAYAVSLAPDRPSDPRRRWLQPRDIHRVDLLGSQPPWSSPWTRRQGKLLALDEDRERLYFSVTDRDAAAAWILPASPEGLTSAAPAIDQGSAAGSLKLAGLAALAMIGGVFLTALAWSTRRRR